MHIVRHSSLPSVPWKNGGGTRQEVFRVPEGGEPFRWCLSVAQIDRPGPFSDFSGYTRNMVLLDGAGVRLRFTDSHEHVLDRVGDLFEFDGSLAASCELLGGACTDLNLISSHTIGAPGAAVHELGQPLLIPESLSETLLLFCVSGTSVVEDARGNFEIMERWDALTCPPADASITCRSAAHSQAPAVVFMARLAELSPQPV